MKAAGKLWVTSPLAGHFSLKIGILCSNFQGTFLTNLTLSLKIGTVYSNFQGWFMERPQVLAAIEQAFKTSKVVALLGPRQCGKTTLAREYFQLQAGNKTNYFDLEYPIDLQRMQDPLLALEALSGLIIIDEIQRAPELFPILRVLVDNHSLPQRYLILGSASRELIKQSSESLAGRIEYIELTPFSYEETLDVNTLWRRGGFPLSFLAETEAESFQWRRNYVRTFLEQDIPMLGIQIPPENLRRFWMMLTHYHGNTMNASELGNAMDLSHHTIQKYLDILTSTFMVRQLYPWHENITKRQVKSKKIYLRDSGLLHYFLNISDQSTLFNSPKIGASWEGFALESIIRHHHVDPYDCYFWATYSHAELDLLITQNNQRHGFEFKFSKAPKLTKSMNIALNELKLDSLTVIYPGDQTIRLSREISCVGLEQYLHDH